MKSSDREEEYGQRVAENSSMTSSSTKKNAKYDPKLDDSPLRSPQFTTPNNGIVPTPQQSQEAISCEQLISVELVYWQRLECSTVSTRPARV